MGLPRRGQLPPELPHAGAGGPQDLDHGDLPLWNPYLFSGTPLLGGFNAGAAYPVTWLMAILPVFTAWTLNLALAYDVALAGMYLFLRRQSISSTAATFGAATFAFAGYMSGPDRPHRPDRGGGVAAVDAGGRPRAHRADPDRRTRPAGERRHRRTVRVGRPAGRLPRAVPADRGGRGHHRQRRPGGHLLGRPTGHHGLSHAGQPPVAWPSRCWPSWPAWPGAWSWGRPSGSPDSSSSPSRSGRRPPTPSSPAARCRCGW